MSADRFSLLHGASCGRSASLSPFLVDFSLDRSLCPPGEGNPAPAALAGLRQHQTPQIGLDRLSLFSGARRGRFCSPPKAFAVTAASPSSAGAGNVLGGGGGQTLKPYGPNFSGGLRGPCPFSKHQRDSVHSKYPRPARASATAPARPLRPLPAQPVNRPPGRGAPVRPSGVLSDMERGSGGEEKQDFPLPSASPTQGRLTISLCPNNGGQTERTNIPV